MKSACIHEVFKGFSDTLNKSHYQNNSDAEIPTVSSLSLFPVRSIRFA